MRIVEISKFEQSVVLHFKTEGNRINAYTLASTLVSIADAAKAANSTLNAGYDVEIVVEAIGAGSFRAKITALYKNSKNLFSSQVVAGVIIGVLTNYIYERTLAVEDGVTIQINTDEVVIEKGEERIIVPRNVYDATRQVENNPQFKQAIVKTLKAIESDEKVEALGFVEDMHSPEPEVSIPRKSIIGASLQLEIEEPIRTIEENVDLQIIKAILERSRRKWEFMWRGIKISAPVTDERFYVEFFAHDIKIAPGDVLRVRLQIKQTRDPDTGIYANQGYEIIEVYEHAPRMQQINISKLS
ncbi:hypothetical protein [Eoetvoesiella caeni]